MSATNVARAGQLENICVGNNVSSFTRAFRFISKSPQTIKPPQSLGLVTIVITINVVIGAFSREHLK